VVHDSLHHNDIVNHSGYAKQVVGSARHLFVQPEVGASCVFDGARVNDVKQKIRAHIPLGHPQPGVLCDHDWQTEAGTFHHLPQESFNPTAKLNTGLLPRT
jgi:hypothetical protein